MPVTVRQLLPVPAQAVAQDVDLAAVYGYPPEGSWVRANMVASVDGATAADGVSAELSGAADKRIFGVLRALADVVLVGAGTARAESYGPVAARPAYADSRAAAGQLPAAALAVVSGSLDIDPDGPLFSEPAAAPTFVVTSAAAPADRRTALAARGAQLLLAGRERVDLGAARGTLAERGLRRVLCEGGPHLLAQLVAAGRLDELCLTVSPQLRAGGAGRVLAGAELAPAPRLGLGSVLEEDGFLFLRYTR